MHLKIKNMKDFKDFKIIFALLQKISDKLDKITAWYYGWVWLSGLELKFEYKNVLRID